MEDFEERKLSAEIGSVVKNLNDGEVSAPFALGDKYVLINLLKRSPGKIQPLKEARKKIVKILSPKKLQMIRNNYIERVLALSEIDINHEAWEKLIADYNK